jgi:hypothetical protein
MGVNQVEFTIVPTTVTFFAVPRSGIWLMLFLPSVRLELNAMTAVSSHLKVQTIPRGRAVAIVLLACLGIVGLPFSLAGLVAVAFYIPLTEAMYAMLTLVGVVSFTASLVLRARGYVARGNLIADAGKEPRRKLLVSVAAVSLIAGVVVLEAVRRDAQTDPIHCRIQQLIQLRQPILNRTQNLLDHQRALLAIVPPDLKGAEQVGELIQQELDESKALGSLIDSEVAEEQRLVYRVLPEWTEVQQSFKDLGHELAALPRHPWSVLASKHTLQLYIALFALVNGLMTLFIAMGHRQIRENGIWQAGALIRWKLIGWYRWENDTLVALIGKTQSSITLPIAREDQPAVENLLALRVAANS